VALWKKERDQHVSEPNLHCVEVPSEGIAVKQRVPIRVRDRVRVSMCTCEHARVRVRVRVRMRGEKESGLNAMIMILLGRGVRAHLYHAGAGVRRLLVCCEKADM
jgi:hypothetical protein